MADGGTALAPQGLGQSIFQALMGRVRGGLLKTEHIHPPKTEISSVFNKSFSITKYE